MRSYAKNAGAAAVRLEAPEGFTVDPAGVTLPFAVEGEDAVARFRVTPPAGARAGTHALRAVATRDGREHREYVQAVEYDHVERSQLLRPAETRLLALDVRTAPGAAVGYVMGSGDALADAIEQLGVPLTLLTADDLVFSDLGRFTTIVTGIRAYETRARPALGARAADALGRGRRPPRGAVQPRGDEPARARGAAPLPEGSPSPFVPYPATVTRGADQRRDDSDAGARARAPAPHDAESRSGRRDWSGWVQERGIQLLAARDPRYRSCWPPTDPFPYNAGREARACSWTPASGRGAGPTSDSCCSARCRPACRAAGGCSPTW